MIYDLVRVIKPECKERYIDNSAWLGDLSNGMPRVDLGDNFHEPSWCRQQVLARSPHIISCVDKIIRKFQRSGLVICGDFNHMKDQYLKRTCSLSQIVTKPTYTNSKIDLCSTNMKHRPLWTSTRWRRHRSLKTWCCDLSVLHIRSEAMSAAIHHKAVPRSPWTYCTLTCHLGCWLDTILQHAITWRPICNV